MSKKSRTGRKERRAKEKRNKKAANRARYAALRDAGQNSKSVRARRNAAGARKVRMNRVKTHFVRMSDVQTTPMIQVVAEGQDVNSRRAGAYLVPKFLTWRQTHNQVTAHRAQPSGTPKQVKVNKKRERRLQRRAERHALAG